jgi:uncharacterized membrane protein YadS
MSDASPASQAAVLPGLALAGALAAAAFVRRAAFPGHLPGALMLAIALAAVGVETDLGAIRAEDWRPLAPGAAATVFMGALAFVPVALAHG